MVENTGFIPICHIKACNRVELHLGAGGVDGGATHLHRGSSRRPDPRDTHSHTLRYKHCRVTPKQIERGTEKKRQKYKWQRLKKSKATVKDKIKISNK